MVRHIKDVQAHSALKSKPGQTHQQQHIHYRHPEQDRKHVSDLTESVLREVMLAAGVADIWITSTVRDEQDQARVMLANLRRENQLKAAIAKAADPAAKRQLQQQFDKSHVGYAKPGQQVLAAAATSLAHGKDDTETIEAMIAAIDKVGLAKVTKHAAVSGRNTVDVSAKAIARSYGQKGYDAFVAAVKSQVALGRIARFGWPEGPNGSGSFFHDGACFHIEVEQPPI
jgi:phosphate/sulfate permease